ncbi:MAG: winged helix-turn-helix transcriptional regulator [bacterium]|nr:winged helix-turn-helix transcriptional regulator [bacterium]
MTPRKAKHPLLSDEALQLVASRFRALGDPTRLRILNTLMQGESSVQGLVEATELEQPNVSRHLAVLRREGIVERRSEGNRALYDIHDTSVVEVCRIVCAGLSGQLVETLDALPKERMWKGDGI